MEYDSVRWNCIHVASGAVIPGYVEGRWITTIYLDLYNYIKTQVGVDNRPQRIKIRNVSFYELVCLFYIHTAPAVVFKSFSKGCPY